MSAVLQPVREQSILRGKFHLLDPLLLVSRLDTLGDRAIDVMIVNPALIVSLASRQASGLGARKNVGVLNGLLHGFPGGPGALGLGEESFNPSLVNEVEGTAEASRENEVEEDTVVMISWLAEGMRSTRRGDP